MYEINDRHFGGCFLSIKNLNKKHNHALHQLFFMIKLYNERA